MNFPNSVSVTSTDISYDDYRRGIQSASSIPIMLSLGLPPSTPHRYPTVDSTLFSHLSPSNAGSPTALSPKSTSSVVTEDEVYELERAGAMRGADFKAISEADNTASDTATPNLSIPLLFPAPESGTRPSGAADGPRNSYDSALSELTSSPWSSSAAVDSPASKAVAATGPGGVYFPNPPTYQLNERQGTYQRAGNAGALRLGFGSGAARENAAGDDADTESFVQPNRRFTSLETATELEGQLVVPDRPKISAGYADIYHGVWTTVEGSRVEVAVKEIRTPIPRTRQTDPEALRRVTDTRIRREVFVWSQTKHRNLHPLLGYRSQPQPRLISPWCHHGNLMDYIRERPSLSRSQKLRLIHQTACGLAYLHSRTPPICHADIKPENILVNNQHEATLSDFGLSRVLEGLGVSSGLTTTERVKGTLNYMARELFEGEKPNLETDVYAFGGLILTVMSENPPFTGLREHNVIWRIMQDEVPRPEEHPYLSSSDPLWSLMSRCWHRTPVARPAMMEVRAELSEDPSPRKFAPWPSSSSQPVVATAPSGRAYPESVPDVELHQMVMPLVEKPLPKRPGQPPILEVRPWQLSEGSPQKESASLLSSGSQTHGSVADVELRQMVMHIVGEPLPKSSIRRQRGLSVTAEPPTSPEPLSEELSTTEGPEDLETPPQKQQSPAEKLLPNMSSQSIMSTEDKAKVKSAIPESCKILYATPVRIYYAHPDPNRWTYIGQEGALTLIADKIKGGFWFRMIDLKGTKGVTWEHELYDYFIYYQDRPFFHCFPGDSCMIGFIFADEKDATAFFKKFNGRAKYDSKTSKSKDRKNVPAKTVKKKSGKIDKSMIGAPMNFQHIAHMGWSEDTGFSSRGVDASWNTLIGGLESFGITEKQLKGNEEFIQQFVEKAKAEGLDAANKAYGGPGAGEGIS